MTRRLVYLSGTRADFGLMRSTLQRMAGTPGVDLAVLATGTHLAGALGTVSEIREAGLRVAAEFPLDVTTRSGESMALNIAATLQQVTRWLACEQPDALIVLGDRGEMLAGAIAALHTGTPCIHIHGGERSGTVDEPVRHAISKLATYHLAATTDARDRLVRMGEPPDRIHVVGAPGLDGLRQAGDVPRDDCLRQLGLPADARFILAVFHPVVQQAGQARAQTAALATAASGLGWPVLWMEPNTDAGSAEILEALDTVAWPAGSQRCAHLPRELFAAAMRHCELMVGNSSAGIIEAATFGTPVLNVGDRQRLRMHGPNVLDVPADAADIARGLRALCGRGRLPWENPWGDGRAGERIASLVAALPLHAALLDKTNSD